MHALISTSSPAGPQHHPWHQGRHRPDPAVQRRARREVVPRPGQPGRALREVLRAGRALRQVADGPPDRRRERCPAPAGCPCALRLAALQCDLPLLRSPSRVRTHDARLHAASRHSIPSSTQPPPPHVRLPDGPRHRDRGAGPRPLRAHLPGVRPRADRRARDPHRRHPRHHHHRARPGARAYRRLRQAAGGRPCPPAPLTPPPLTHRWQSPCTHTPQPLAPLPFAPLTPPTLLLPRRTTASCSRAPCSSPR